MELVVDRLSKTYGRSRSPTTWTSECSGSKEKGNTLGRPLAVRKYRITQPRTAIEIVVDAEPHKAGSDPYNKLVDRVPDDNVKELDRAADSTRARRG
jgi:hypothetical protein